MSRVHALKRAAPLLLVGAGGFAGAVSRHAVAVSMPMDAFEVLSQAVPGTLPRAMSGVLPPAVSGALPPALLGTFAVNVLGSFALGALLSEAHLANALSAETRLVVGTGFLSSFTTYSTFAVQTASLSPGLAVANVAGNYALGFLAVLVGQVVARWAS